MKTTLLLVDIQNDYFTDGKSPLEGSLQASLQAKRLLEAFRQVNLPVIHIRHVSIRPGSAVFLPGSLGANIHENVQPLKGEMVIQKNFPNSFRETSLLEYLRQQEIERLVICGMMTHMCVDATVRAAYDYGFECWVAQDACATRALAYDGHSLPAEHVHLAFLAALRAVYARVLKVDEIIGHLAT